METIGVKIYNLRKERDISQEELGFALNVSRQTVSRWERDFVNPTVENLESLTKFFGVNPDYFLSGQISAVDEENEPSVISEEKRKPEIKFWKILISVAVIALLALGVTACGIATYVAVAPVQGQEVITTNRFNTTGIVCLSVGLFSLVLLTALSVLCIKKRRKN